MSRPGRALLLVCAVAAGQFVTATEPASAMHFISTLFESCSPPPGANEPCEPLSTQRTFPTSATKGPAGSQIVAYLVKQGGSKVFGFGSEFDLLFADSRQLADGVTCQGSPTRLAGPIFIDDPDGGEVRASGTIPVGATVGRAEVCFSPTNPVLESGSYLPATFEITPNLPPVVSVGDATVYEGHSGTGGALLTVSLSKPSLRTVTVAYATADEDAISPGDYTAKAGTLNFAPGVTSLPVKVAVAGDTTDESDEGLALTLSSPTKATLGDSVGRVGIIDDDASTGRTVAIGDAMVHEGDAGTRVLVFNVRLSEPGDQTVSVSFATAKGSAIGTDFTAKSGTLNFAPGTTTLNVKVAITPDALVEGDESFSVNLSAASGALIADGVGIGTIIDND